MADRSMPADARAAPNVGVVVVHGVGETEPGWINTSLIGRFEGDKHVGEYSVEDHSEVYRIVERGRKSKKPFLAHVRRLRLANGADVSIAELFWADLSRVGKGPFSYSLAMLMVLFEAPLVLVRSLQRETPSFIHRFIRRLLLIATWLVRWPIAGLTVSLFYSGFVLIALAKLGGWQEWPSEHVPVVLAMALPVLMVVSLLIARESVHRYIGLTDLGLSTAVCAALFLVFVLVQPVLAPIEPPISPVRFFLRIFPAVAFAWGLWWGAVLLATMLLLLVQLGRFVGLSGRRRPSRTRLRRSWAALAIVIAQQLVWRVIVAPLAILMLMMLEPCLLDRRLVCPLPRKELDELNTILLYESQSFVLCLIGIALIAGASLMVVLARMAMARLRRDGTSGWRRWMPRLIISPIVTLALVAALLLQLVQSRVLFDRLGVGRLLIAAPVMPLGGSGEDVLQPAQLVLTTTAFWLLIVFLFFLRTLGKSMHGALHIARELIDHQYTPSFGLADYLLPHHKRARKVADYPRRDRILRRLEALVKDFSGREHYDRIIFLGHSQGTVIIHDYLRSAAAAKALDAVPEIHVLTLGSPLTHLYQHYIQEYGVAAQSSGGMHKGVLSWTNMWRMDDPISSEIEVVQVGPLCNVELARGGHTDYWRLEDVRRVLMQLIRGDGPPKEVAQRRPSSSMADPADDAR